MKSLYYPLPLLVFCFLASPAHGALGRHNGIVSLGFAGLSTDATAIAMELSPGIKVPLWYAFNVELGYLLHSVRASKTIHAMDLRLGFNASFPSFKETYMSLESKDSLQYFLGSFNITYAAGREIKGHRLMFDVIGHGFAFGSYRRESTISFGKWTSVEAKEKGLALRIDLILPLGINFIASNGVAAGFRHRFSYFIMGDWPFMEYNISFHIGYAFGGKS